MVYSKPEINVVAFDLNQTVASCDPETTYEQVSVPCVVTQSHTIFYAGCDANYNDLAIVNNFYTTSQGKTVANNYLVWSTNRNIIIPASVIDMTDETYKDIAGSSSDNACTKTKTGLVDALVDLFLGSGDHSSADYHAGIITPKITSVVNASL